MLYCNVHICSYYYYPGTTTLTAYSCLSHWTSHLWPHVQLKQSLTSANLPTSVSNMSKTSRMCLSFPTASSVFLFLFSHLSFTSKMVFSKPSLLFKWPISFWLWRSVTIALIFHFGFLPNWLLFSAQSMIFFKFLKPFYTNSTSFHFIYPPPGGGGEVLPYIGHIGMCRPKG